MEVAAGAVIYQETRVMRDLQSGVERREKRVVQHGQDLPLHLHVGELLAAEQVLINNLESEVCVIIVSEAAEEDPPEVPGAEVAEELEVAQVEGAVVGEGCGGFDGRPMRIGGTVGSEEERRGGSRGGRSRGGGETVVEAES